MAPRIRVERTHGGKHTRLNERYDLVAPEAERAKCQVLAAGALRYNDPTGSNWRKIPVRLHLNHALKHVYDYLEGRREEPHLVHAYCRLMFAVALSASETSSRTRKTSGG